MRCSCCHSITEQQHREQGVKLISAFTSNHCSTKDTVPQTLVVTNNSRAKAFSSKLTTYATDCYFDQSISDITEMAEPSQLDTCNKNSTIATKVSQRTRYTQSFICLVPSF